MAILTARLSLISPLAWSPLGLGGFQEGRLFRRMAGFGWSLVGLPVPRERGVSGQTESSIVSTPELQKHLWGPGIAAVMAEAQLSRLCLQKAPENIPSPSMKAPSRISCLLSLVLHPSRNSIRLKADAKRPQGLSRRLLGCNEWPDIEAKHSVPPALRPAGTQRKLSPPTVSSPNSEPVLSAEFQISLS